MTRYLAVSVAALAAAASFHSSYRPLTASERAQVRHAGEWHKGCPVSLSGVRLLSVSYRDWDGKARTGQIVVRKRAARPLARVFRKLFRQHFRIRHMAFGDTYGPVSGRPADGDVTASFECRQAVPSPCVGGTGTGSWSMHAYGEAVDVNPVENPYVGCGQSNDPSSRPYFDRAHHRKGMVTPKVVGAFRSVGWGWGGAWYGSTKDYMHFSSNGH
jgi:hypothetical protein